MSTFIDRISTMVIRNTLHGYMNALLNNMCEFDKVYGICIRFNMPYGLWNVVSENIEYFKKKYEIQIKNYKEYIPLIPLIPIQDLNEDQKLFAIVCQVIKNYAINYKVCDLNKMIIAICDACNICYNFWYFFIDNIDLFKEKYNCVSDKEVLFEYYYTCNSKELCENAKIFIYLCDYINENKYINEFKLLFKKVNNEIQLL